MNTPMARVYRDWLSDDLGKKTRHPKNIFAEMCYLFRITR